MNINDYADFTDTVWKEPAKNNNLRTELAILSLGLVGEAGEVVEKIKKLLHYDKNVDLDDMKKELGDVAFYFVRLCRRVGFEPSEVLQANIDKLSNRKDRGVIWGEGSNR